MFLLYPQLLVIALWGILATLVQADASIGSLFSGIPSGIGGSCFDQDILSTIDGTKTLVNNAINVLRELQQGPIPNNMNSVKKLNVASAMFGIRYALVRDEQLEVILGKETLKDVEAYFTKVQNLITKNQPRSSLWKMQCGDTNLNWATTLGDLGVTEPDSTTKDNTNLTNALSQQYPDKSEELSTYKGLFFSKYWSPKSSDNSETYEWQDAYYLRPGPQESTDTTTYCKSWNAYAMTSDGAGKKPWGPRSLVLCDAFFKLMTLSKAKALQRRAESIDQLATKAGILVHELMHIATLGIVEDVSIPLNGKTVACLDWEECRQCANVEDRKYIERAVKNAEQYKLFAEGVFLSKVDWWPEGWDESIKCPES